ncbi:hypothetical protein BHM03_00038703 [Ensete ventricosum]|nr:hypothetical protein BHM03_00038703 [Ensete ventricosum]
MNSEALSSSHSSHAFPFNRTSLLQHTVRIATERRRAAGGGGGKRTCLRSVWPRRRMCAPPFLSPLRISSRRTPKLKTSDFTEKVPPMAYSGAT